MSSSSADEVAPGDPFDLERFLGAQAVQYPLALAELHEGRKRSHWIWYILPQVAGLGTSTMSRRYAIRSLDEARAYLAHPVLGTRLRDCVAALLHHADIGAIGVLGAVDARKLQSCLTLFGEAAEPRSIFEQALLTLYGGARDEATLAILARESLRS